MHDFGQIHTRLVSGVGKALNIAVGSLASCIGVGSAAIIEALRPTLPTAMLLTVTAVGCLPLLLITALALIAVYSSDPVRRTAAERVLGRLLATLGRRKPSTRTNRQADRTTDSRQTAQDRSPPKQEPRRSIN